MPVERRLRVLTRLFTICGVLLVPWIGVLVEQLHGQAFKRSFNASWVGLDVLEAICLLGVAQLMRRRHRATSPAAAATAAILCMDAWFDLMSAAPQLPYAESLAMACLAELPLAALLAWTAWHSLTWAAPRTDPGQAGTDTRHVAGIKFRSLFFDVPAHLGEDLVHGVTEGEPLLLEAGEG